MPRDHVDSGVPLEPCDQGRVPVLGRVFHPYILLTQMLWSLVLLPGIDDLTELDASAGRRVR
jgi:hypothetical protein